MSERKESVPILPATRPFLVLCVALLGEACAGVPYWWPALQPGLNKWLHFSSKQGLLLIATANSGSSLGIIGGLFYDRYGPKITATVGAVGLTASFAALALLTALPVHESCFWLVAAIALLMLLFSYMLYSTCLTAAAAVFPEKYRGRVVGLCSGFYGASSGIFGALQAAFFPTLNSTPSLLIFTATLSLVPAIAVFMVFSNHGKNTIEPSQPNDTAQLYRALALPSIGDDESITTRLRYGYRMAYLLVASLLASAIAEMLSVPGNVQKLCAIAVLFCILAFQVLPIGSRVFVYHRHGEDSDHHSSQMPFTQVLADVRYLYLCFGFFATVGGGGIAWLVQASNIVSSRFYETGIGWQPDIIAQEIRICVIIFSSCNVAARLIFGSFLDTGASASERMMFKYNLLHSASLMVSVALAASTVASSFLVYLAVALIGLSHGAWFVSSPALTTLWFGVHSFPRNFAVLGIFVTVGSATLASAIPSWLMDRFGTWTQFTDGASIHRVCVGLSCTMPIFSLLCSLNLLMYIFGWLLKKHVKTHVTAIEAEGGLVH